jgi:Protein of unknown function (DUF998)
MHRIRQIARPFAVFAIAGQIVFVAAWVVAGAFEPGYTHVEHYVSDLGATGAANPWIVNAGLVVMGLSIAGLGPALVAALPRRRSRDLAAELFVIAGVSFALTGIFQLDCGLSERLCVQRSEADVLSGEHYAHLWAGFAFQIAYLTTPFVLARFLWGRPSGAAALGAGIFGIATYLLASGGDGAVATGEGLVQRLGYLAVHAWAFIVAGGVLYETRRPPVFSEPTPMPPREFFQQAWAGDGEIVFFPSLLWRRFPLSFTCRRESTFLSDDVWYYDDQVVLGDGRVEARRRFCQLVAPDRIHVTADDMPDGAEVALGEDGFGVAPFWWTVPIGPVRWPLRCREESRFESDGTFVETFHLRSFGLPAGRMTFRVRSEGAD